MGDIILRLDVSYNFWSPIGGDITTMTDWILGERNVTKLVVIPF